MVRGLTRLPPWTDVDNARDARDTAAIVACALTAIASQYYCQW